MAKGYIYLTKGSFMSQQAVPIPQQFLMMATAKMVSKPMYVAAKLCIADHIQEGISSVTELAKKTSTHERSLYRLLRALSSVGVFKELENQCFALTPLAECMLNQPGTPRGMLMWFNDPIHDYAWENLLHSVQTGEAAFNKKFNMPIFDYFMQNKEIAEVFNTAMSSNALVVHSLIAKELNTQNHNVIYDIGGGHGHLMVNLLKQNPNLKGGVFDLAHVVEGAIKDSTAAFETFGGDFFEEVPKGADAHVLAFIIHDWDDQSSKRILTNCYNSLEKGGKIYLCENVIEGKNEPSLGKLLDIEMLVMCTGQERTENEFKELLEGVGFTFNGVRHTEGPVSIVEATK